MKSPNDDSLGSCRVYFLIIGRRRRVIAAVVEILDIDYNSFRRAIAPTIYLLRLKETRSRFIIFLITVTGSAAGDVCLIVKVCFSGSDGRRSNGDNILKERD